MGSRRAVALAAWCGLLVAACSSVGDESRACSEGVGRETLDAAGMGADPLEIVEGCVDEFEGLRQGEIRTVVARGSRGGVESALREGGIDPSTVTSLPVQGAELPSSFDVQTTASGERRAPGDRLALRDEVEHGGRTWDRYVEWGRMRGGPDYVVAVVLEAGSL
jgi:hypothetical protein